MNIVPRVSAALLRAAPVLLAFMVPTFIITCGPSEERALVVVQRWLLCEECDDGELDSVLALGRRAAVEPLAVALLGGPPANARTNVAISLRASYQSGRAFLEHAGRAPMRLTEDEYVTHYLANFVGLYQKRAAHALGRLGGNDAREALTTAADSAARGRYRADVGAAIRLARDSL